MTSRELLKLVPMQAAEEGLKAEVTRCNARIARLQQDLQDQAAAADENVQSMTASSKQTIKVLAEDAERAAAQAAAEHQRSLDAHRRTLKDAEVHP